MANGEDYRDYMDKEYLGSWDFRPGEEKTVTIKAVEQCEVFEQNTNKKKKMPKITFYENVKPIVANNKNSKMIIAVTGIGNVKEWNGQKITLRVEKDRASGKLVDCIRVSPDKPKSGKVAEGPPSIPPCGDCGGEITGVGDYTAEQVAAVNFKRYGVALCADCGNKRKEEKKENVDT